MNCKNFVGAAYWVDRELEPLPGVETCVQRFSTRMMTAVLKDDAHLELGSSFRNKRYAAQLKCNDEGIFEGKYVASDLEHSWQGFVTGRLFQGVNGIFFYGTWTPDSGTGKMTFWADLQANRCFEEAPGEPNRFVDNGLEFITITQE